MPSLLSKLTLVSSIIISGGIVFYVHKRQVDDRLKVSYVILMEEYNTNSSQL